MMKKSLLAFATIALTTGAWGDEVTYNGVIYTIDRSTVTPSTPSPNDTVSNVSGVSITSATSGYITAIGTINVTNSATVSVDVTPNSLSGSATPSFAEWQTTEVKTVDGGINTNSFLVGSDDYDENIVRAQQEFGNDILVTYSEMAATLNGYDGEINKGISVDNDGNYVYFYWNGQQVSATVTRKGVITASALQNLQAKTNYDECYYYKVTGEPYEEDGETYVDYYYYAITSIEGTFNTVTNTTTTTTYTPTTIPSGLDWSSVTSFTIGASINEIDENAFATTEANKITIININANNTVFAYANNILSDYNKQNIIFVTSGVNNSIVELDESYVSVAKWATYSCKNVTFYWTGESFTKGENQGDNVTFEQLGGEIKFTDTADGGKKVQANTIFSNKQQVEDAIADIISTTKYVDLRGAIYKFSSTLYWESNNGNKIIIVDETSPIRGVNVVYFSGNKFVCEEFQLSDNYKQYSFYNPITFTAALAIYDRVIGEDYSSICLPFNVSYVAGNPRFMVGTLDNYDAVNNIFTFTNVKNDLSANTPYFIYATNGPASFNNLTDVTVEATPATPNNVSINGATLCGTFSRVELSGNDNDNAFYGFSNGALAYIGANKTGYANTFRAYLKTPKSSLNANNGASTIRFINESETAIENVKENKNIDNEAIYNLNGQRVSDMNANGIYVKNGKKIIVK